MIEVSDGLETARAAFVASLKSALDDSADEGVSGDVVDIYNSVMELVSKEPTWSVDLAETAVRFFSEENPLNWPHCLFLELSARCLLIASRVQDGCRQLDRLALETKEVDQQGSLIELADDVRKSALHAAYSADVIPIVLASLTRIYARFGETERLIKTFLSAAAIYSNLGAHQAAYRSLSDAETAAHEVHSLPLLAEVYAEMAAVSYVSKDFASSVEAAEQCLRIYKELEELPPARILLNMATARMHLNQHAAAAEGFRAYLADPSSDEPSHSFGAAINLAACLRQVGDLGGATEAYALAGQLAADEIGADQRLEFELIGARLHADLSNWPEAIRSLRSAALALGKCLERVHRLHHRRGLRERFVNRFESILGLLPGTGKIVDVLEPLAVIYGGIVSDWLSVLDWEQELSESAELSSGEKDEVAAAVTAVRAFGAPFLMGFREKHDDPWSPLPGRQPWDVLGGLADRLAARGCRRPTGRAELEPTIELLQRRLSDGYCLLAPSYGGSCQLWCLTGEIYRRFSVDLNVFVKWKNAQRGFNFEEIDLRSFVVALEDLQQEVGELLAPVFDGLNPQCPGLIYLQDFVDVLPIMALALGHAGLRRRMAEGIFEVRTVPSLYGGVLPGPLANPALLSIGDSAEDLGLADAESKVAATILETSSSVQVEADAPDLVVEQLARADVLVVSTHGAPISLFTDPFFGSLGGATHDHCISVDRIQRDFIALHYRLVLLNTCNGAVSVAKNFQQRFRTHDAASYPALLLLNRESVVGAALWKISDTVSYLHTVLTAEGLREGLIPSRALARSAARLCQLSSTEAIELLSLASETQARNERIQRLRTLPPDYLSHPYFTAGFGVYSLL
jgi:tetratricopeptide (TPR) repeat protein